MLGLAVTGVRVTPPKSAQHRARASVSASLPRCYGNGILRSDGGTRALCASFTAEHLSSGNSQDRWTQLWLNRCVEG